MLKVLASTYAHSMFTTDHSDAKVHFLVEVPGDFGDPCSTIQYISFYQLGEQGHHLSQVKGCVPILIHLSLHLCRGL